MAKVTIDGVRYELLKRTFTARVDAVEREYKNMKSYTIPEEVTADGDTYRVTLIGAKAFNNCPLLEEIIIPDSVTEIESSESVGDTYYYAFHNCTSLKSITLPNKLTKIGDSAFKGCTGLTSITIPNSVTKLGGFDGCTGLTSITIPNSVTKLYGFNGCTGLTSITIPSSVTYLGGFNRCTGLTSITIPNSVTTLYGFDGCTGLTSVSIPNSVKTLGYYVFKDYTGLTSITIPSSATRLDWAFRNCSNLTLVIIENEEGAVKIGEYAFKDTNAKITYVGKPKDGAEKIVRIMVEVPTLLALLEGKASEQELQTLCLRVKDAGGDATEMEKRLKKYISK